MILEVPNARGWLRVLRPGENWGPWVGNAFTPFMKESMVRHWTGLTSGSYPYKLGKAGGSNPAYLDVRDASAQLGSLPRVVDTGYPTFALFSMTYVWTVPAGVGTGSWINVYVCAGSGGTPRMSAFENQTIWGSKGAGDEWAVQYKVELIP